VEFEAANVIFAVFGEVRNLNIQALVLHKISNTMRVKILLIKILTACLKSFSAFSMPESTVLSKTNSSSEGIGKSRTVVGP
jgi:hypothetical protein